MGRKIPIEQRLAERTIRDGECIIWTGCKDKDGYGLVVFGHGKMFRLTRVLWKLAHGPIPPKMFVCHTCDRPSCVNVKHFFLGTAGDNTRDMIRKGRNRNPRGERHSSAKLPDRAIPEIIALRKQGLTLDAIAKKYGVAFTHISKICRGESRCA